MNPDYTDVCCVQEPLFILRACKPCGIRKGQKELPRQKELPICWQYLQKGCMASFCSDATTERVFGRDTVICSELTFTSVTYIEYTGSYKFSDEGEMNTTTAALPVAARLKHEWKSMHTGKSGAKMHK